MTHITGRIPALFAVALATFLTACGGGGGGTTPTAPPAATTTSKVAAGTITGFGSVYVNGVRYDSARATVTMDDSARTEADLKVGMVVQVRGSRDSSGNHTADRIDFDDAVEGPVTAIDATAQRLTVLGQTVQVSATTSFDDNIPGAAFAGLVVGDVVEVSGLPDASGVIEATRIEKKPAGGVFEVTGKASAVNTTARTFAINGLTVNYSTALLEDFGSAGAPRDGDLVEAKGTAFAGGVLTATRVELKSDDRLSPDARGEVEVEGYVTRFVSATDFDVAGRAVTTTSSTTYEFGTAADLGLNIKVEVEGALDAAGVLVARKVQFKRKAGVRIEAQVQSVDTAARTFRVLNTTVAVDASSRLEDKSDLRLRQFRLEDLRAGDWVEIRGSENPPGSNSVYAARLERERPQSEVRLRGFVKTIARPDFTILAIRVATTPSTRFERPESVTITADEFFANAANTIVDVRGSFDGTTLTAQKVELNPGED